MIQAETSSPFNCKIKTRSHIGDHRLQSSSLLKCVLDIYDAHLFIGICWWRPDNPEPVYTSGSPVRILGCGPTLPPLRATLADRHGTDVFAGSNRRCIRRTLGGTTEPGRALRGDRHIPRAGTHASFPFACGSTDQTARSRRWENAKGVFGRDRCRKIIRVGNFYRIALGALRRPYSGLDIDRRRNSGARRAFIFSAVILRIGCGDFSWNCAACGKESVLRYETVTV